LPLGEWEGSVSPLAFKWIGYLNIVYVAAKPTFARPPIETDHNPLDGPAGKPSSYVAFYWTPLVQRDVPAVPEHRMHAVPILVYGIGPPQAYTVGAKQIQADEAP